jgi:hypothetical protein
VCSNDGLVSASLLTVSKLLQQVRAVDRLSLRRRDMLRMLMKPIKAGLPDASWRKVPKREKFMYQRTIK